ncbi:MAG TPA: cytochrome c [Flavisolibacter sp.]
MNRNYFFSAIAAAAVLLTASACNDSGKTEAGSETSTTTDGASTDPKGIGKYRNVELTHPLDEKMVAEGQNVYNVKCASCHKLTDEKLVGPGWKGVTDRRTPEWIMNFSTNVDEMIEKDTAAQRMLEQCLVRMPNQNLSDAEARATLEFMRKNDGKN